MVVSVLTRVGKCLLHELEAKLEQRSTVTADLLQHLRIVGGIDDNKDVTKILRRRAHQARTADVDLLDEVVEGRLGVCRRLRERIQVHDDEVDRDDAVAADGVEVVGTMPAREDAAVNSRMQGLDPAVHHLGKPGDFRDIDDGQTCARQGFGSPARRDELDAKSRQPPSEVNQARFVGNTQDCTHMSPFT